MKLRAEAESTYLALESVVFRYIKGKTEGAYNSEIAKELGLESAFEGRQKNYLTYSIVGSLINKGKVVSVQDGRRRKFRVVE